MNTISVSAYQQIAPFRDGVKGDVGRGGEESAPGATSRSHYRIAFSYLTFHSLNQPLRGSLIDFTQHKT